MVDDGDSDGDDGVVVVGVMVDLMPGTILNAFHISLNVPNDFRRQVL
jgi:hypothetical protein